MGWKLIDRTIFLDDMEIVTIPDEVPEKAVRNVRAFLRRSELGEKDVIKHLETTAAKLRRRYVANTGEPWPYKH